MIFLPVVNQSVIGRSVFELRVFDNYSHGKLNIQFEQ